MECERAVWTKLRMTAPLITVIIPTRPGDAAPLALAAARQLDHPADRLEIIVARGQQPSVQRNTALRAAKGELIYFLDDDSLPPPGTRSAPAVGATRPWARPARAGKRNSFSATSWGAATPCWPPAASTRRCIRTRRTR
ncbi:MAG: glycosyltransferase family 2 protein [Verrucomicrobia bacterium]|nr:glycosyltransferase family 2 protein [Verrucomicrobiota bacterium]